MTVGAIMIMHGYNHGWGGGRIPGTAGWFSSLGLKHGKLQAWASVITEIGAGILLILGVLTPLAAAATLSIMLVAGLLAHRKNGFFIFKEGYEYVLALGVVALVLGTFPAGKYSIDNLYDFHAFGLDLFGWTGFWITLGVGVVATAGLLITTYRPQLTQPTT
ncbi:DoxX family protein [Nocardioides sp. P5_C9_2]